MDIHTHIHTHKESDYSPIYLFYMNSYNAQLRHNGPLFILLEGQPCRSRIDRVFSHQHIDGSQCVIGSEKRRGQLIHPVVRLTVTIETKAYSNAARGQNTEEWSQGRIRVVCLIQEMTQH